MVFDAEALTLLSRLKLPRKFQEFDLCARGYADLGFEVFLIMPNCLLSLTSGEKIYKTPDFDFFYVPRFEELILLYYTFDRDGLFIWFDGMNFSYNSLLDRLYSKGIINNWQLLFN